MINSDDEFQSSPTRKGGCYARVLASPCQGRRVSILTHPKGWVLRRSGRPPRRRRRGFNPHPPERVGATEPGWTVQHGVPVFQSSPTRKGGCYRRCRPQSVRLHGCFNPHPPERVGATSAWARRHADAPTCFNPHPPERVGATAPRYPLAPPGPGFNPHPPERVGATTGCPDCAADPSTVSILTHPKGWVLRLHAAARPPRPPGFNPHPPERVGATGDGTRPPLGPPPGFNPHPPERVGATSPDGQKKTVRVMFQSSPTRKGGCYLQRTCHPTLSHRVSILTHPKGWVLLERLVHMRLGGLVSILTHPFGWVLLPSRLPGLLRVAGFQSSPTLSGGCYLE